MPLFTTPFTPRRRKDTVTSAPLYVWTQKFTVHITGGVSVEGIVSVDDTIVEDVTVTGGRMIRGVISERLASICRVGIRDGDTYYPPHRIVKIKIGEMKRHPMEVMDGGSDG